MTAPKIIQSETHFQRVINLSRVLMVLVFALLGTVVMQQVTLREMRDIDCAAYAERMSRADMYDQLVALWRAEPSLSPDTRVGLIDAYLDQRESVQRAVDAGSASCG